MYGLTLDTPELQKETKDLSKETINKIPFPTHFTKYIGACTLNPAILKQVKCFDTLDSLG